MALCDPCWGGKLHMEWNGNLNGWASPASGPIGPHWPLHMPSYAESFQNCNRLHTVH